MFFSYKFEHDDGRAAAHPIEKKWLFHNDKLRSSLVYEKERQLIYFFEVIISVGDPHHTVIVIMFSRWLIHWIKKRYYYDQLCCLCLLLIIYTYIYMYIQRWLIAETCAAAGNMIDLSHIFLQTGRTKILKKVVICWVYTICGSLTMNKHEIRKSCLLFPEQSYHIPRSSNPFSRIPNRISSLTDKIRHNLLGFCRILCGSDWIQQLESDWKDWFEHW